jgi:arylsulfatase A-like enzyme
MLPRLLAERGFATAVYSDFAGDIFPRYDFGFAEVHAPTLNFLSLIQLRLLEATPQLLPYLETSWGRRFFPQIRELASHALPELLTDEAIEGMERNAAAGRPGFSLVFYSTAHFPYAAPYPAYRRWARPDYGGPNRFQRASNFSGHASEADVKQLRGLYDGALWAIDRELARMVEALRAKGLDRQTILVVTADHGENLYEGELGIGHGDHLLGEASLRVPLAVIDLRETKPAPRVEERVVRSLDLAPTLLGRLGLAPPASFQGVDLLAPGNSGSLPALTETELWFVEHSDEPYQALRFPYPSVDRTTRLRPDHDFEIELQPRYRDLVYFAKHLSYLSGGDRLVYMPMRPRPQWRLYDVGADPLSARDLAATRPERLRALKTEMLALMSRMAPVEERGGYVFWQEPR